MGVMRNVARALLVALLAPALLLAVPGVGSASSTWIVGTQTGSNVEGWELVDYAVPDPDCTMRAKWSDYSGLGDVSATLSVEGRCEWVFTPHPSRIVLTGSPGLCSIELPLTSEETSGWWDPSDETSWSGSVDTFTGCEVDAWTLYVPKSGMPDAEVYGTIPLGDATEDQADLGECPIAIRTIRSDWKQGDGTTATPNTGENYERLILDVTLAEPAANVWFDADMQFRRPPTSRSGNPRQWESPIYDLGPVPAGQSTLYLPYVSAEYAVDGQPMGVYEVASIRNKFSITVGPTTPVSNAFKEGDGTTNPVVWDGADPYMVGGCTWWIGQNGTYMPGEPTGVGELPGDEELADPTDGTGGAGNEPPTEAGCGFDLLDPSTWASGGICALVYLMKKAVALLKSILAAVSRGVSLAWDGLVALWVPDEGAFGNVDELKTTFETVPPGSLVIGGADIASGMVDGLSSSCGDTPDFSPPSHPDSLRLPNLCDGGTFGPEGDSAFGVIFQFVRLALYALLGWRLWALAETAFKTGGDD